MAVAVEHLSKAYLASISDVLLAADRPKLDDLLILSGNEDRVDTGRANLQTIGGGAAIQRAETLLGKSLPMAEQLTKLRKARNGTTHMGWGAPQSECRDLLAASVQYAEMILPAVEQSPSWFWGDHLDLAEQLVEKAVEDLKIRYHAKLRRAEKHFRARFAGLSDAERESTVAALELLRPPGMWLTMPAPCPACGSTGTASGRDWAGDYGDTWFLPRRFACPACGLQLTQAELHLAGIESQSLDEPVDADWEPDYEDWDPPQDEEPYDER